MTSSLQCSTTICVVERGWSRLQSACGYELAVSKGLSHVTVHSFQGLLSSRFVCFQSFFRDLTFGCQLKAKHFEIDGMNVFPKSKSHRPYTRLSSSIERCIISKKAGIHLSHPETCGILRTMHAYCTNAKLSLSFTDDRQPVTLSKEKDWSTTCSPRNESHRPKSLKYVTHIQMRLQKQVEKSR